MPPRMRGPGGGTDTTDDTTTEEEDDEQQDTTTTQDTTDDIGGTSGVPTTGAGGGQDTTVDDTEPTDDSTDTTDTTETTGTVGGSSGVPTPGGSQDTTAGGTGEPTDTTDTTTDTDTTTSSSTGSGGTGSGRGGTDRELGGGGELDQDLGGMDDDTQTRDRPDDPMPGTPDDDIQTIDPQEGSAGQGVEKFGSQEAIQFQGEAWSGTQGTTTIRDEAQAIEQAFLERNPEFDAEDVAVVFEETQGGGIRPEIRLTSTGAAIATAEAIRQQDRVEEGAVTVEGGEVQVDTDRIAPAAGVEYSWAGQNRSAPNLDVNVGMGAGPVETAEPEQPEGVSRRAQTLSPGGSPAQTDVTEDFGDIDWSFGYGDPDEDEVETAVDEAADDVSRAGRSLADEIFRPQGPGGQSLGEELLLAAGRPDLAKGYEENLEAFGRGLVGGGTAIVNVPGVIGGAMEATELAKYAGEQTVAGRGVETGERLAGAGLNVLETALERPYRSVGLLGGSLAASTSIMRAAREIGPRTGVASRVAIQPGEEAAGFAGNRLTRFVASERTAERLFPANEPLIFSEEAAIRAAKAARARAGAAVSRTEADTGRDFRSFLGEERGMARLTGLETGGETETGSGLADEIGESLRRMEISQRVRSARERAERRFFEQEQERGPDEQDYVAGEPIPEAEPIEPEITAERAVARQRARMGPSGTQLRAYQANIEAETTSEAESMTEQAQQTEVRLDDAIRRRFETNLAIGADAEAMTASDALAGTRSRAEAATSSRVDTLSLAEVAADARAGFESELDIRANLDSEVESLLEQELEAESETEVEGEAEAEGELELRREFEAEQEIEQEQEAELELEGEGEIEVEPEGQPDQTPEDAMASLGLGEGGGGRGDIDLGAGFFNEFVTALALGPGPRRAPEQSELSAADLTEQRPTQAMLEGTEQEQAQIEAAEAFVTFEDAGLDLDEEGLL